MAIKRMDHVSVVVEDLPRAIAFFTALGMTLAGQAPVEGRWADRINNIDGLKVDIAMMVTPDGHNQLELTKFHSPALIDLHPSIAPPNALGLRSVMFAVDSLEETLAKIKPHGAELIGEIVQYENQYLLCYTRGPAGVIVALAQELF